MKTAGIIILVIGLLITIYTGFNFVTKEKVVDIGNIEITQEKNHTMAWSPLLGIGVMVLGGIVFFYGSKRNNSM